MRKSLGGRALLLPPQARARVGGTGHVTQLTSRSDPALDNGLRVGPAGRDASLTPARPA